MDGEDGEFEEYEGEGEEEGEEGQHGISLAGMNQQTILKRMMMSRDPAAIFLITIDPRDSCSMHHKYSKWLTKYEEE